MACLSTHLYSISFRYYAHLVCLFECLFELMLNVPVNSECHVRMLPLFYGTFIEIHDIQKVLQNNHLQWRYM